MFTGIIQELSSIQSLKKEEKGLVLGVLAPKFWKNFDLGESIAVNGVCLTLIEQKIEQKITPAPLLFYCQEETLAVTSLKKASVGESVNLERALRGGDRFGGHWVQGHVDFMGEVFKKELLGESTRFWIKLPKKWTSGIVLKGSIALDGISLTVSRLQTSKFAVDIIPHTYQNTNVSFWEKGTRINVETDIFGKYVKAYLEAERNSLRKS